MLSCLMAFPICEVWGGRVALKLLPFIPLPLHVIWNYLIVCSVCWGLLTGKAL